MRDDNVVLTATLVLLSIVHISAGYECNFGSVVTMTLKVGDTGTIYSANYPNAHPQMSSFCQVDFQLCPGCILDIRFDDVDFISCTGDAGTEIEGLAQGQDARRNHTALCKAAEKCDYAVWWSQETGLKQLTGHQSGTVLTSYASAQSPWLHFCYSSIQPSSNHVKRWKLDFVVNDQYTYRIHGRWSWGSSEGLQQGVLRSTGFPQATREQAAEYTYLLQGQLDTDRVILQFADFYIHPQHSLLTLYDGSMVNKSVRHLSYSGFLHPPVFQSHSQHLLLHYATGHQESDASDLYWGFKAIYNFVNKDDPVLQKNIITDCEQIHLFSGGVLLQHGEDRYDSYEEGYEDYDGEKGAFYDCVWPLPAPSQHASSLTLLNVSFPDDGSTKLEIKNAFNSDGKVLATVKSASDLLEMHSLNFDSDNGLYVHLSGVLRPEDVLLFSYTVFKPLSESTVKAAKGCQVWVKGKPEEGFICSATMRCIPKSMVCDMAPHCGNMEDETANCHHYIFQDIAPSARRNSSTCYYPMILCGENRCVNHAAHCYIHPAKNCWGPWNIPCNNKQRCYRVEEKCDKVSQCGDNTDEADCLSAIADSLGHVWFFFLPVVLLALTFAGGCVIYKTRKTRSQYRAGQVVSMDNLQMHTFPAACNSFQPVAPPSYEEVIASPDTYVPTNNKDETEPLLTARLVKQQSDDDGDEDEICMDV